jgi:hypothetical protein
VLGANSITLHQPKMPGDSFTGDVFKVGDDHLISLWIVEAENPSLTVETLQSE